MEPSDNAYRTAAVKLALAGTRFSDVSANRGEVRPIDSPSLGRGAFVEVILWVPETAALEAGE